MGGDTLTLEKIFEEAGFIARWEARGLEKGLALGQERLEDTQERLEDTQERLEAVTQDARNAQERLEAIARNALAEGLTFESVSRITGFDMETIQEISHGRPPAARDSCPLRG